MSKRPDGDGTVRKRADGRWEGRIVIGHKEDGAPIFKSVFAASQKELMPKLHAAIVAYRGAEITGPGGIYQLSDHLYEGRYTPTNAQGKREAHNVYAKTKEECEALLEKMIEEVRERIKGDKKAFDVQ